MTNDFLSQDEVDALLKGVPGQEPGAPQPQPTGGTRTYNLATEQRIIRERMPALDTVNDRFSRRLAAGMFGFLKRNSTISTTPVRIVQYSEFIRGLGAPASINVVRMPPLRGNTLFVLEPGLVFAAIDNLFGSDGRYEAPAGNRDFSITEQRVILRLLDMVMDEYRESWRPVHTMNLEYVRSESDPRFAGVATLSDIVVVSTLRIEIGSRGGNLHICIPYSSIEPMREVFYANVDGERAQPDQRWAQLLQNQVQAAEVDMVVQLSEIQVSIQQILNMRAGDVITLDMPERIIASVDGVPIFECQYGTSKNQYAIRVGKVLAASSAGNQPGDAHA